MNLFKEYTLFLVSFFSCKLFVISICWIFIGFFHFFYLLLICSRMLIVFHFFVMVAMFFLLAIVCDMLFVPALERIAEKLKMSAEFAGATLMAIGSSAPELFTSLFSVLNTDIWSEVWAWTIVWSAIFNILVIIWASAMVKNAKVSWKPIVRDLIFYSLTIVLLLIVFRDGTVVLRESILFVGVYIIYIRVAKNRWKWLNYHVPYQVEESIALPSKFEKVIEKILPLSTRQRDIYIFVISICLIAIFTHFMVESWVIFARWIGIPEVIVWLTILAAWTSVPDLISSIIAAKKWQGDMAISNWIGSNIFDILFGLWFPYMIYFLFVWWPGSRIEVSQTSLHSSILLLFATVISVLCILLVKKRNLTRWAWLFLILLYVCYVVRNIIIVVWT